MVIEIIVADDTESLAELAMLSLESIVNAWKEGRAIVTQAEDDGDTVRVSLKTQDDKITTVTVEV